MAKLIVLALAFAALVAFATAHTTIITTTIEDENPISGQRQCSQRLQGQRLNQCRMFLQQGQIPFELDNPQMGQQQQQQILQQCCQQLQNVEEQCQCEAVKQVFREAQQQVQQQQGPQSVPFVHSQQAQRLKQKAQILPNVCNLQSRRCEIGIITTTVTESNIDIPFRERPFGTGSQQCRETEIQRPVSQCQRFVEQQMQQSPRSTRPYQQRPGQQQQRGLQQQCCNELQNVKRECQCEAVQEVARRVMRQPQQHQQQRRGQFGGQEMETARRVIQNLPNQCDLEVQQCNIPYGMM
ncbi:putative bifunctional inhibitor/plant lipid transfer protein/seed storage helical [Helianthus anomalus]